MCASIYKRWSIIKPTSQNLHVLSACRTKTLMPYRPKTSFNLVKQHILNHVHPKTETILNVTFFKKFSDEEHIKFLQRFGNKFPDYMTSLRHRSCDKFFAHMPRRPDFYACWNVPKITVFWDVTPYRLVSVYQRTEGT